MTYGMLISGLTKWPPNQWELVERAIENEDVRQRGRGVLDGMLQMWLTRATVG
jgi:hypothetical protein